MAQKILVVSDSHGRGQNLEYILKEYKNKVDAVVHCGDAECGAEKIQAMLDCPLYIAKGNCDYYFDTKRDPEPWFEMGGHTFLVTHGHRYGVNWDESELVERAMEVSADVIFFGHTHVPAYHVYDEEGVITLNPGSISQPRQYPAVPTFLILDLNDDGTVTPHFYQM